MHASREMRPGEKIGDPFVEYNVTQQRLRQLIESGKVNPAHVFYPEPDNKDKFHPIGAPAGKAKLEVGENLVMHCWITEEYEVRKMALNTPDRINTVPLNFYISAD